ncbi:hypothetical protein ACP4I1_32260 [Streptomyces sp. WG4]|uniref:hypothetical protein n=1 Tax=unclassified Streptomyces TaxID=2593676 RepID=UPI0028117779|nr:hypothetical protein [Streptomyces sp.]
MPRHQSTAAQRAREAQRESGGKYTAALREASRGRASAAAFPLRELLAECTTCPEWSGDHPEVDAEWAPRMFDSTLLGGPVPHSAVLMLAGELAGEGLTAAVRMESRDAVRTVVLVCGSRRFQLVLSQDNLVYELCLIPGCGHQPVAASLIPYCADTHLTARPGKELAQMAWRWGNWRRELARTPGAADAGDEGDALIAAAVAQGAFSAVIGQLLDGCYGDPDLIDEVCFTSEDAVALRHAIDHERLLLTNRARAAATRIRVLAGGQCDCGRRLILAPETNVPARYCSARCAPVERQPA